MNEISQQWRDEGSGPGHMQAVIVTPVMKADQAYRKFLDHAQACTDSCPTGVNCEQAAELYQGWRDLKNAAA